MTRSFRLLAVAVLAAVLALSSAQNAFASVELAYDDGISNGLIIPVAGGSVAVRFSLQAGWSGAKLVTARYSLSLGVGVNSFTVYILDQDQATDLTPPFTVTPSANGWFDVDLTAKSITVTRDFYIVLTNVNGAGLPALDIENTPPISLRSWGKPGAVWLLNAFDNLMIRAVVDPIFPSGAPVGGFVEPVNKLTVFAPYLAL